MSSYRKNFDVPQPKLKTDIKALFFILNKKIKYSFTTVLIIFVENKLAFFRSFPSFFLDTFI